MIDRVERELVLPAAPPEVWALITTSGWLADEVELDLVPGGEAHFTSDNDARAGWVEEAKAPDGAEDSGRLIFWWSEAEQPATRVELSLVPERAGSTRLHVREERPLEVLDAIGIPLPGGSEPSHGPLMLTVA